MPKLFGYASKLYNTHTRFLVAYLGQIQKDGWENDLCLEE